MRTLTILAISSALLAACASGSSKSRTAKPAVTDTGAAATPTATATATPLSTAAEDAVMEETVRACLAPALPDDAAGAASGLDACLNQGEGGFHVAGIEGGMPLILIEVLDEPGLCRAHAFIVWQWNGWHIQNATALLPDPVNDRLLGQYALRRATPLVQPSALARQGLEGDTVLLSVLAGVASCGSGPGTVPMLFVLDGDTWRLAWDQRGTELATLSDTEARFTADAGDMVQIHGALWTPWKPASDPAGKIFHESHPGPHRYVDQTWTRAGQRYALTESDVEPSAYNTLVRFVYRLSTSDDAGAATLLADPSLLDTAKQLGLVQQPLGLQWNTKGDPGTDLRGPIHILSGPEWNGGPPQPVVVTFVQRGADWLISGIARE